MSKDLKVVRKKAIQICGRRAFQATSTMREQLVRRPSGFKEQHAG